MRKLACIAMLAAIVAGTPAISVAHSLDGEHSWLEQLGHQLLGAHHLALTVVLLVVVLVVLRQCLRRAYPGKRH